MTQPKCGDDTEAVLEAALEQHLRKQIQRQPEPSGPAKVDDPVNHPSHYTFGKYEVIDVLEDWQLDYHLASVVKYVARAGRKGGQEKKKEDLEKARFYLNRAIARCEDKNAQ